MPLTGELLKNGVDLKLIVRSSDVSGPVDAEAAQRQNIEIRTALGHGTPRAAEKAQDEIGVDVVAILKDFFNV